MEQDLAFTGTKVPWCLLGFTRLGNTQNLIQHHFCFYSHVIEYSFLILQQIKYFFRQTSVFYGQGIFTQLFTMKKRFSFSFLFPFSPILFLNDVGSLVKTSDLIMIRVGFPRGENPSFQLRSDSKIEI